MKQLFITATLIGLVALTSAMSEVRVQSIQFGGWTTLASLNGDTVNAFGNKGALENQPVMRYGGWTSLNATSLDGRLSGHITLAVMNWHSLPLTNGSAFTRNQLTSPGLGQAYLLYKMEQPVFSLNIKMGAFPHHYSKSKNLGNYLYSSGTYPNHLKSSWWNLVDGVGHDAKGALVSLYLLENSLRADFSLFIENGWEAQNSISPGLMLSYKYDDLFEVGTGAVFSHLINWSEKTISPKVRANAYANGSALSVEDIRSPGLELNDTLIVDSSDSRFGQFLDDSDPRFSDFSGGADPRYYSLEENGTPNSQLEYYTYEGIKWMGYASVTPYKWLEMYGEVAVLGVKNYPTYYAKMKDRMPYMLGVAYSNERFELRGEYEYLAHGYGRNIKESYENSLPIWEETEDKHNEMFWSLSAVWKPGSSSKFSLKAARDHIRTVNFFGNPSFEEAFKKQGGYYIAFKSEFFFDLKFAK